MSGQSNAAAVIIKRRKVVKGDGHHGGAWKVAYADFVTAMMAFFMLMWLLNATTEKQRKGLADYFNPTIPINRISGGGDGAFGGDSVFSEQTYTQSGTGASQDRATRDRRARGQNTPINPEQSNETTDAQLKELEKVLLARSGESMTMERAMRHVVTRVSDEGLIVDLFDVEGSPLFAPDSVTPEPVLKQILSVVVEVFDLAANKVAVQGHVRAYPITLRSNPAWRLSIDRADAVRRSLVGEGLSPQRMRRVAGMADSQPVTANPMAIRNNRIEIILLRHDR
ncbi:OmpA family protein [Tabrizicola sp. J26]|uniref:flagellar motor protein MotB n=1 Tax=Alitabrizicola rongguiensis TaxID=2909234 RepID=UPI001F2902CB|nr:flagellar motor protein MotB [Tabrizicola rongguiensis]MCF1710621.1 OmpA family protein [Tabrizicola rongguiensis]